MITAEVDTVEAVVTCKLDGLLTTAPVDYLPLYSGTMTIGVLVNGTFVGCGAIGDDSRGVYIPSVGPTLVMAAVGACVFPATEPAGNEHVPVAYWATHDLLDSRNYTVHGKTGAFLAVN